MAPKTQISFTPVGTDNPKERLVVLPIWDGKISMPVGRASKREGTEFFPGADNAWFECPVMSRSHATLTVDDRRRTIFVTDNGSMHGTFADGRRLENGQKWLVLPRHKITFGARVDRGSETTHPLTFYIKLVHDEPGEQASTNEADAPQESNRFSVPLSDADDSESGSLYGASDDENLAPTQTKQDPSVYLSSDDDDDYLCSDELDPFEDEFETSPPTSNPTASPKMKIEEDDHGFVKSEGEDNSDVNVGDDARPELFSHQDPIDSAADSSHDQYDCWEEEPLIGLNDRFDIRWKQQQKPPTNGSKEFEDSSPTAVRQSTSNDSTLKEEAKNLGRISIKDIVNQDSTLGASSLTDQSCQPLLHAAGENLEAVKLNDRLRLSQATESDTQAHPSVVDSPHKPSDERGNQAPKVINIYPAENRYSSSSQKAGTKRKIMDISTLLEEEEEEGLEHAPVSTEAELSQSSQLNDKRTSSGKGQADVEATILVPSTAPSSSQHSSAAKVIQCSESHSSRKKRRLGRYVASTVAGIAMGALGVVYGLAATAPPI